MEIKRTVLSGIVAVGLAAVIGMGVYAVPEMPGGGGTPGEVSTMSVSYTGVTEFSESTTVTDATYSSNVGGQNALLVSGGEVRIEDAIIEKTGDESDENSDFYGTNAGILVYNGGKLILDDVNITTNGGHANAVFAYGSGTVEIEDSKIVTSGNNSGGVMVTGGGTLTAKDVKVETAGNSSAAIRSDRGGGTMKIEGGSYKTTGVGSPAIYSTAEISVEDAKLEATASEGVVIEGSNSVSLEDVSLTDTNNTLNGNSKTYKNVFIYQSMSGDADEGTGTFTAKDTKFTTNQGDTFFVTNTTAVINLTDNTYINNDSGGVFLRAQAGAWGNEGANGGQVSLSLYDDEVKGDMVFDEISNLTMHIADGSYLRGAITGGNGEVKISSDSVWVLEGDVELDFLEDEDGTFQNIYGNGHTLTVNGEKVDVNTATPPEGKNKAVVVSEGVIDDETEGKIKNWLLLWVLIGAAIIIGLGIIAAIVVFIVLKKKEKKGEKSGVEQKIAKEADKPQPDTAK